MTKKEAERYFIHKVQEELEPFYKGPTVTPESSVVVLKASDIQRFDEINSRLHYRVKKVSDEQADEAGEFPPEELNESVRDHGLLQAPVVSQLADGRFFLVAGNRRVNTMQDLVGKHAYIKCEFKPSKGTDEQRLSQAMVWNGVENFDRMDVSNAERADYLWRLQQRTKMRPASIARELKVNERTVASLIRVREKLAPDLWEKYLKNPEKYQYKRVLGLVPHDYDKQRELWKNINKPEAPPTSNGDGDGDGDGNGKDKKKSGGAGAPPVLSARVIHEVMAKVRKKAIREPSETVSKHLPEDANLFWQGYYHCLQVMTTQRELYDIGDEFTTSLAEFKEYERALKEKEREDAKKAKETEVSPAE